MAPSIKHYKNIKMPLYTTSSLPEVDTLKSENISLKEQLQHANRELEWFREQYKLAQHRQFGKQSEATNTLQANLFDEQESDEVTETTTPIDETQEKVTRSRPKKKSGRNIDTSKLPRITHIHDLPENEKICDCGCELTSMGEDKSEQIDIIPEQVMVVEHITPKYACRKCEKVTSATKPETPITKGMATANFIADIIIKKYDNHLPLYRQSKIFERDGIDIPDNTLGNWVSGAADALSPLGEALFSQLDVIRELQVDETPVKILKPDKKGYMWCYNSLSKNNRFIAFEFSLSRGMNVVDERLRNFHGLMQTDGYSGYNNMRHKRTNIISLGCMDHARRKFTDAIKVTNGNKQGVAGKILAEINKLYKIERKIKESSLDVRLRTRQEQALPILDAIKKLASSANVPPKSKAGDAITYLLNQWEYLAAYIEHPEMPISNILVENQIRPLAIGKKNWMFVGNESAANKAGLLYSLIQTCKMNQVNPRQYLNYVLTKTHAMRRGEIDPASLLPQFIDKSLL